MGCDLNVLNLMWNLNRTSNCSFSLYILQQHLTRLDEDEDKDEVDDDDYGDKPKITHIRSFFLSVIPLSPSLSI